MSRLPGWVPSDRITHTLGLRQSTGQEKRHWPLDSCLSPKQTAISSSGWASPRVQFHRGHPASAG